jgi:hypothetical protein
MYQSFQNLYGQCQSLSSDDNTATLTLFKGWINKALSKCYANLNSEYFYSSATDLTVDGTFSYPLPYNCSKLHTLVTTISTTNYVAREFPGSENEWNALLASTTPTESTYPTYFFVKRNTVEIYPTSSTSGYTLTMKYKVTTKDLSADDHITGTILTATNGSTSIVGNAPSWTSAMVGRYLKITGDEYWYEIAAVPTATTITLAREYAGTSIVAGTTAYTIGEMSLLPEGYQDAPVDWAMGMYYLVKENPSLSAVYMNSFNEKNELIKRYGGNDTTSGIIEEDIRVNNPNDFPQNLS